MLDKLQKHHIGIIIPLSSMSEIEIVTGNVFVLDEIQGARVLFRYDPYLQMYVEYIAQEGRAAKQKLGFAHICYNVTGSEKLERVELWIKANKAGFQVTPLEKSGSRECGCVTFYFIKNVGLIELNLITIEDHVQDE